MTILATAWTVLGVPALGFMVGMAPGLPEVTPPETPLPRCVRVGAIDHLHLRGDPVALGYGNGRATAPGIAALEREMYDQMIELVPGFMARHLLLGLVSFHNRGLSGELYPAERREIAALARGYRDAGDPHRAVGPTAGRLLQYHALHDVSQYLIDNPLVNAPQVGCTAVAVTGAASVDGHLRVGRLFDFEGGRGFDVDKVVCTVEPDVGEPFVSVAWSGVAGAVTGLNRAGVWVSLNAAVSDTVRLHGRPMIMIAREILQHCRDLGEAIEVLRRSEVFVSEAVLLAARADGRAVVVEKGPGGMAVRPMDAAGRLVLTNHFLAPAWADDAANRARVQAGTTGKRYARAHELLARRARHDCHSLLDLLRDRRGAGDVDVGFGNRGTINAWIGAHLVVADVSAGVLWVCEPRHGLGRALAFDVHGPRPDLTPLPASPDLPVQRTRQCPWRTALATARTALARGDRAAARRACVHARELNPRHFEAWYLAALASDDPAQRHRLATRALALQPAYAADEHAVRALLTSEPP